MFDGDPGGWGGTLEDDPQNKQRGAGRGRRTGKGGARSALIPKGQGRGGRSFGCAVVSFFPFIRRVAWVLVVVFAPAFGCAVVSFVLMFGLSLGCWLWSLRPSFVALLCSGPCVGRPTQQSEKDQT